MFDAATLQLPEFYEIIPEFNHQGRLCNHGSGDNTPVIVPIEEWERFNQLAGRQHEIIDGVVVFNPDLKPCMPDEAVLAQLKETEARLLEILDLERIDEACGTKSTKMTGLMSISEKDMLIQMRNTLKQEIGSMGV